jgi:hypothetical protein
MNNQFEVKRRCEPINQEEFYRFISMHYFHQDALSWRRANSILGIEGGVLLFAFGPRHHSLRIGALVAGSVLILFFWKLIQRDWEIRDRYNKYFAEFHEEWGITLSIAPTSSWYRSDRNMRLIVWSMIIFNLFLVLTLLLVATAGGPP